MRTSVVAILLVLALGCGASASFAPSEAPIGRSKQERPAGLEDTEPIVPNPIPANERLAPCAVELAHTEYDEETRAPHTTRHRPRILMRLWPDDRENQWRNFAPIPLTREQARRAFGRDGVSIPVPLREGGFTYTFDAQGRTERVSWDPTADSSDYQYTYRYTCPRNVQRPHWGDDYEDE
jgi:hypothetical protein